MGDAQLFCLVESGRALIRNQMSVHVGGWLSLIGFIGLALCAHGWNNSERGSTLETLSAVGVLVSAVAAVVMVFQGFHLWNTGWDVDLTKVDRPQRGRKDSGKSTRERGNYSFGNPIFPAVSGLWLWGNFVAGISCDPRNG